MVIGHTHSQAWMAIIQAVTNIIMGYLKEKTI